MFIFRDTIKRILVFCLCLVLLAVMPVEVYAANRDKYTLMNDIVFTYKTKQNEGHAEIRSLIRQLKAEDLALGKAWQQIMDYWEYCNDDIVLNQDVLPDNLPDDDSLCIVVLGFELNPDGSMKEELTGRCEVALSCAEKYPNANILVTGGGTARNNRTVTEADSMAGWLKENGIDSDRIIIENQSLTTFQNAMYSYELIKGQIPQTTEAAIISSDYHVPLGCLLFNEEFQLAAYKDGSTPIHVISNACFETENFGLAESIKEQANDVWAITSILDE